MNALTIYKQPDKISKKLLFFNVTAKELQDVAVTAASARNEATPLHPANAAGIKSYLEGVATLRRVFVEKEDWEPTRYNGIEAISNRRLKTVILFQNVDSACSTHDPNPVTSKGGAVAKLVDNSTLYLWPDMEEEAKNEENKHVWFFCVSCSGDEVRAELSRPRAITNGNFGIFLERIFVLQDDDESLESNKVNDDMDDIQKLDIPVIKKA